jgi:hypothetical protein
LPSAVSNAAVSSERWILFLDPVLSILAAVLTVLDSEENALANIQSGEKNNYVSSDGTHDQN